MAKGKDLHIAELTAKGVKYKRALDQAEGATKKSAEKIRGMWDGIGRGISGAAKSLLALGLVWKAKEWIRDSVELSGKVQGIKEAFDRLNKPGLLEELRKATRGTVNDLELMQTAVRASNFRIPLDQLSTLLEFAQKRATQTGESVDYLVNSIIDGIGRKSTLVLDNLGISATELQAEVKKVGDFGKATGNIVSRELGKMGDVSLTARDRVGRLGVKFQNIQAAIATGITPAINAFAEALSNMVGNSEKAGPFIDTLVGGIKGLGTAALFALGAVQGLGQFLGGVGAAVARVAMGSPIEALKALEITSSKVGETFKSTFLGMINIWKDVNEQINNNPIKPEINTGGGAGDSNGVKSVGLLDVEQVDDVQNALDRLDAEFSAYLQKWAEGWSSGLIPKMLTSTEEFANVTDERIQQILDNWSTKEQQNFNQAINAASQLGYAIQNAFDPQGDKLLSYLNQSLQIALQIAQTIQSMDAGLTDPTAGWFNILSSGLGLFSPLGSVQPGNTGVSIPGVSLAGDGVFNNYSNFNDNGMRSDLRAINNSIQVLNQSVNKWRIMNKNNSGGMDVVDALAKIITREQTKFNIDNVRINK